MSTKTESSYTEVDKDVLRGGRFRAGAPARTLSTAAREIGRFARAAFNFVNETARTVAERRRHSRYHAATVQGLSRLPDHLLKDIGVPRSEIFAIAAAMAQKAVPSRGKVTRSEARRRVASTSIIVPCN
jgi:uncharacterized protein YjiS (DUF1127 family)